jgi:hypothetical protein
VTAVGEIAANLDRADRGRTPISPSKILSGQETDPAKPEQGKRGQKTKLATVKSEVNRTRSASRSESNHAAGQILRRNRKIP